MAQFKQKCFRCKINYVATSSRGNRFPVCFDCEKNELTGELTNPILKELLNIPEEFYKESGFLRSIKINAIKYNQLSERQIEAFKSVVDKMKSKAAEPKEKKELTLADIPEPTTEISMRAMRLAKKAKKKKKSE